MVKIMYPVDAPSQGRHRLRAGRHQMFLSTVNGRYWVELVDQVTADWESLRMNHGIAKEFREAMRTRTVVPSVALALQLQLPFQVGLFSFGLVAAAPDGPSDDESGFDPALG